MKPLATPAQLDAADKRDYAANLARFLTERTGPCLGSWKGRMPAAQQRELFGRFLGKGKIIIDGNKERVAHMVKRDFGLDYEVTVDLAWRELH